MKDSKSIKFVQHFDYDVSDYEWDGVREELVQKSTKRNLVDEINSFKDCRLDCALDKFLNPDSNIDMNSVESVVDLDQCNQDLLRMGELISTADEYRERYNLPLSMSVSDVYSFIDEQAKKLGNDLNQLNKLSDDLNREKELNEKLKKEVKINEAKKNVEESK